MSKPAHKIKLSNLAAIIWRNSGEKGDWFSVQINRGYKVDDGWRNTDSLGQNDIALAIKLLEDADKWIKAQLADTRQAA